MTKEELEQAIRMSVDGRVRIERGSGSSKEYGGRNKGWARLMGGGAGIALAEWDNGEVTGVAFPDATLKVVEPFPPGLEHLVMYETARLPPWLWWPSERAEMMAAREALKREREQALEASGLRPPVPSLEERRPDQKDVLMNLTLSRGDMETILLALTVLAGSDQRNADEVEAIAAHVEAQLSWQDRS